MCLVNGYHRDVGFHCKIHEKLGIKPLGGDIDKLVNTVFGIADNGVELVHSKGAVDVCGSYPRLDKRAYLILHKRNKRGNHNSYPLHHKSGYLIAQGFSCARGHYPESVSSRRNAFHKLVLTGTEAFIPEIFF